MKLSFDQYQRFQPVKTLLESLLSQLPSQWNVLDIGGHPGLLEEFIPSPGSYYYCDIITPQERDERFVPLTGKGSVKAPDQSFDIVVSIDTLEHLPPVERSRFLQETTRLAKAAVILNTPVFSNTAVQFERFLNNLYLSKGIVHDFLAEHLNYQLPSRQFIEEWYQQHSFKVESYPQNNLVMWFHYMLLQFLGNTQFNDTHFMEKLDRFLIQHASLFDDDSNPAYRRIFYIPLKKQYDISLKKVFAKSRQHYAPPAMSPLLFVENHLLKWEKTLLQEPTLGFAHLRGDQTLGELLPPNTLQLSFECTFPQFTGISFYIGTFQHATLKGELLLRVSDNSTTYYETSFPLQKFTDNSFLEWRFPPIIHSQNKNFKVEIVPRQTSAGKSITLWMDPVEVPGFSLKINEKPVKAMPLLKLYHMPLKEGEARFFLHEKKYHDLQSSIRELLHRFAEQNNLSYSENQPILSLMQNLLKQHEKSHITSIRNRIIEHARQEGTSLPATDDVNHLLNTLIEYNREIKLSNRKQEERIQSLELQNHFLNSLCNTLLSNIQKTHHNFLEDARSLKEYIVQKRHNQEEE